MEFHLYLIPLCPLLGAAIALLIGKRLGKGPVMMLTSGSVAASAVVTVAGVLKLAELPGRDALVDRFFSDPWIKAGDLTLSAGLTLDHLSAVLCLVVTGIGFLIH